MENVSFPDGPCADAFKRLVQLHPGKNNTMVLIRALTAYHALYEMYLEGSACDCVKSVMDYLDEQDERINNESKEGDEWQDT
jgi:hypothetical protein